MNSATNPSIYYRLVALWVLCEAMLGGVIHGLRLPVSGLFVGGAAVMCIALLAWYVPGRGIIMKATITVAVFKMTLSPQAPPPAYIAVFFQGFIGELLFINRKYFKIACLFLAVLAMIESAFQRILVLTIVYGNDLWKVTDRFINSLTGQAEASNYSWWIGAGYVGLHIVAGLLIGYWAGSFPGKISRWSKNNELIIQAGRPNDEEIPANKKKKRSRIILIIIWGLLLLTLIHSWLFPANSLIPKNQVIRILVRSVIIVLTWYFIFSPMLTRLLHHWLRNKQSVLKREIESVLQLLPDMKSTIKAAWKKGSGRRTLERIKLCVKVIAVNTINEMGGRVIHILSGPVHSGKTTALMDWIKDRTDVSGILTPVVNGRRMFFDIKTGESFNMEANDHEATLMVGKYRFSAEGFRRAALVIKDSISYSGWIVIDEIGPMELRNEGFASILQELLKSNHDKILLVVREKDDVMQQVLDKFKIRNAIVVHTVADL